MSRTRGTRRQRWRWVPRVLSWGLFSAFAVAWVGFLLPVHLGGGTAFVIVQGHSMEPLLRLGDLAVTRKAPAYGVGDVVVFVVDDGRTRGMVIHRIVSGSAQRGWITQGDNNDWRDQWRVPETAVLGKLWFDLPGAGRAMEWTLEHPFAAAGVVFGLVLAAYLPVGPRRLHPDLRAALKEATRAPTRGIRPVSEYAVLWTTALGTLATSLVVLNALLLRQWSPLAFVSLAGFLGAGSCLVWLIRRLYDGWGKLEPTRTRYALSGRLHRVDTLPTRDDDPTRVRSALELRAKAEKYRLPILHREDPVTGQHAFLLITLQEGDFLWEPVTPRRPESDEEPDFFGGRSSGATRTLNAPASH